VMKCTKFGSHDDLAWSSQVSADEHLRIECVYCLVRLVVFFSVSVVILVCIELICVLLSDTLK
jgi:hypothetical protein